jgi:hypothetical protein
MKTLEAMNKVTVIICTFIAALALTSCDKDDNPVTDEPTVVNLEEPQEEVTDQPAYSRVNGD